MALFKKATKSPPGSAGSARPPVAPRGTPAAAAAARGVFVEKPRANVYTVMLIVSFFALLIGCICLGAEMSQYDWDFKAAGARVPPEAPDLAPPPVVPVVPPQAVQAPPAEAPPATPPAAATPEGQPPAAAPPVEQPPAAAPPEGQPPAGEPPAAAPPAAAPM